MVTKLQLKEKILVKLGKGAIRPNVTDVQVEQAIDEAVQFFYDRVEHATDEKYYKHKITQEDIDRGDNTIILPDNITTVNKILPVRKRASISFEDGSAIYNFGGNVYNYLNNSQHSKLADFYIANQYIEMFKSMFSASDAFSFSKFSNRVQLDLEVGVDVGVDDYLVFHVKTLIDPNDFNRFYNDRLLFNLATAYTRKYEAVNLTKIANLGIPNNTKFDVTRLETRADDEIKKFEKDIEDYYRPTLGIYVY